ncbi:MAG: hypothetical protein QOG10_4646 [Kribbellaceae bacterium]|jgi:undecaprenyl-diphosphatase|nr:hypothetical protein [Kribbellaceae bacterium]
MAVERLSVIPRYAVPAAGLVIAAAGTLGVAGLADSAKESNGLAAFDPGLTADAVSARTTPLTDLARALTFLGDVPVLSLLAVVAAALLWQRTRSLRAPGLLMIAMAGSAVLTYGLKLVIGRHRPGVAFVLGPIDTSFGFPSGHTLNSTVFLGTLVGLAWVGLRSGAARIAVASCALLLSVGIGSSRIYLGYHWVTDVLAGWLIAATWLTIVGTAAYLTRHRPGPTDLPPAS